MQVERFLRFVLAVTLGLTVSSASFPAAPSIAQEAEDPNPTLGNEALSLPLLDVNAPDAEPTTLGGLRGAEGVVVVFLSNTCPYVLDWAERIPRLESQARERDVGLVLVNSNARKRQATDSPEAMRAFAAGHLGELPYFLDESSRLADALDAKRTPEAFLFDAEMRLVYRGPFDDHSGPFENAQQHWLRDAIDSLGTELQAPESQPALGCAVQRPRRRRPAS